MKQSFNLNTFFYNCKRALYALMILTVIFSIPVLSYMELSRVEEKPKTEIIDKAEIANHSTGLSFSKQF